MGYSIILNIRALRPLRNTFRLAKVCVYMYMYMYMYIGLRIQATAPDCCRPQAPMPWPRGEGGSPCRTETRLERASWIIKPKAGNYCKSCGDGLCRATTIYCRALLYIRAVRQRQMTLISLPVRGNAYWTPGINVYETSMPIFLRNVGQLRGTFARGL